MTSLLGAALNRRSEASPLSMEEWIDWFSFGGNNYGFMPTQTLAGKQEKIGPGFLGLAQGAYHSDGIVFACMLVRMLLFAEVRFQYRQRDKGRAGKLFGDKGLEILEKPWINGTTGDLASRAIQDVDLAGNFFVAKRPGNILRRLRPDCVTIVYGSTTGREIDLEVAGYIYEPKGDLSDADKEPLVLLPNEVAHFAPIPDPLARGRGMSWITPVIREILGDKAATGHKLKFFENGATPNLVVKFDKDVQQAAYDQWVDAIEEGHKGAAKAYKTMYLGGGADVTVVGGNMKQIDFKEVQGHGETRIAAAAGTPPVLVGLSEGLKSATYSNYQQAIRRFSDGTMRPLWRNFSASMAPLINVPENAELWYDDRDIPFLQEDTKDAAEIQSRQAETISKLITAGYEPETVVAAVEAGDFTLLKHTGMVSVQMWKPGDGPDSAKQP